MQLISHLDHESSFCGHFLFIYPTLKNNIEHHTPKIHIKGLRTVVVHNSMNHLLTLGGMPPELKIIIAECCDRASLLNFRLVSTEFYDAADLTFIDRHIRKRTHTYTLYGLQALVDLTSNRRLARHVEQIALVSERLHDVVGDDQHVYVDPIRAAEANLIADSGVGADRLRTILENLNKASSIVEFSTAWTDQDVHPYGLKARKVQLEVPGTLELQPVLRNGTSYCNSVLEGLLQATVAMDVPIMHLNSACGDGFLTSGIPRIQSGWARLQGLQLNFGEVCWTDEAWLGLAGFIAGATKLNTLALTRIRQCNDNHEDVLIKIASVLRSSSLERLFLAQCCCLTGDGLTKLLLGQQHSLQCFAVSEIGLSAESSWQVVAKSMADELSLSSLELIDLHKKDDEGTTVYLYLDGEKHVHLDCEGLESVKQGLLELVRDATYAKIEENQGLPRSEGHDHDVALQGTESSKDVKRNLLGLVCNAVSYLAKIWKSSWRQ
ncbi:hypothetical protein LTR56_016967 [Elasticomyces elasticus]|nr:hypothetical protein LTR56_016967 [Elasticomyces elasticus]KAK3640461.1 hypothetical protein LTR22_017019 [Elasticomyces elasticus]KAK4931160.1 hypothetical protein LTR49_002213 [Elasticomyces elasticus]KAK5767909.1 hypothetical protein LTS12_002066 [Elasticomyces elasticus]